jgi:hypothetical protein
MKTLSSVGERKWYGEKGEWKRDREIVKKETWINRTDKHTKPVQCVLLMWENMTENDKKCVSFNKSVLVFANGEKND